MQNADKTDCYVYVKMCEVKLQCNIQQFEQFYEQNSFDKINIFGSKAQCYGYAWSIGSRVHGVQSGDRYSRWTSATHHLWLAFILRLSL